jgi:putative peptide zinc metalloprotease protein
VIAAWAPVVGSEHDPAVGAQVPLGADDPKQMPPRLAEGMQLLGEYRGSGTIQSQHLLRRRDGGMVAVSRLLYLVVSEVDGRRTLGEIAARVTPQAGRTVSAANIAYLVEHKLRPLGVMDGETSLPGRGARPILGLSSRRAVVPDRLVRWISGKLCFLFVPAVVRVVLAALAAMDLLLLTGRATAFGMSEVLRQPSLLVLICLLTIVAAGFHELGHATAGRYGGADPGVIGVGIYLIWPAFFSDLTDSYRLGRRGRLRADLGGVYFNVLFMLLAGGLYALTGRHWLVLLIVLQHLAVAQQFLPFLRLDGYYLVSDLAGVPDLFGRIRPILCGLLPGHKPGPAVLELKPRVRRLVTVWVLTTVVLLTASLGLLLVHLPQMLRLTSLFVRTQAALLPGLARGKNVGAGLLAGVWLAALAIPLIGFTTMLARLIRRARPVRDPA